MEPRPTILVVDDDEDIRYIAMSTLRKIDPEGRYRHLEVAGADAALAQVEELAGEGVPLLVLCDYRMPGRNGVEVAQAMRGLKRRIPLWFVLLTSMGAPATATEARAAGVDRVLEKEFSVAAWTKQLGGLIDEWVAQTLPDGRGVR